jgi:hypothetical protein
MLLRNISKTILLTPVNITKQYVDFIEKPDLYNTSLALQLGEKYKEMYIHRYKNDKNRDYPQRENAKHISYRSKHFVRRSFKKAGTDNK